MYDQTAAALLHTLTQDDIADALEGIRENALDCSCGDTGRSAVYRIGKNDRRFAVKFVDEEWARAHRENTGLLQFFRMPIVPCVDLPLKKNFDLTGFYTNTNHNCDAYVEATHVVVMPFVPGESFQAVKSQNNRAYDIVTEKLNNNILRYATPICLAYYWDCLPKNVIVKTSKDDSEPEKVILDPNDFTFIDAEHGLLSKHSYDDEFPHDIRWPIQVLEVNYLRPMTQQDPNIISNTRHDMYKACGYWQKQIEDNFTCPTCSEPERLRENLLYRTKILRGLL